MRPRLFWPYTLLAVLALLACVHRRQPPARSACGGVIPDHYLVQANGSTPVREILAEHGVISSEKMSPRSDKQISGGTSTVRSTPATNNAHKIDFWASFWAGHLSPTQLDELRKDPRLSIGHDRWTCVDLGMTSGVGDAAGRSWITAWIDR